MSEIINLSKAIKYLKSKDGQAINLPSYCRKRISFLKYNKDTEVLEIICSKCGKSFPVLQLEKDTNDKLQWNDIHKESDYHFMSEISGYAAECVNCKNNSKEKTMKNQKINNGEKLSYTVFLTPENKKYLQLYKIIYGKEITEVINYLIDELREEKPIEIKIK